MKGGSRIISSKGYPKLNSKRETVKNKLWFTNVERKYKREMKKEWAIEQWKAEEIKKKDSKKIHNDY